MGVRDVPLQPYSIKESFSPPDHMIPLKSTWWLTMAQEALIAGISLVSNLNKNPDLLSQLRERYNLVNLELMERMRRNVEELPDLKHIPKGGFRGDVCASGV